MQIVLFCEDIDLLQRWERHLNVLAKLKKVDSIDSLLELSSSIIVLNEDAMLEDRNLNILRLLQNQNRILYLSRSPELESAKKMLSLGVSGYGNSLMNQSFFSSALDAIKQGFVWIAPQIVSDMVKDMTSSTQKRSEDIFSKLTQSEQKIAEFIKDGYKNQDIADELNVSLNTIKTHIKSIYEKLGVKDRLSFATLFT